MLKEITIYGSKVEIVPLGHRMKFNDTVKFYGIIDDKEIYYSNDKKYVLIS